MSTKAGTMTADALWNLRDDGTRRELVEGELRVMTPAGAAHGRVAWALAGLLFAHVREADAGVGFAAETGFVLGRSPDTVRAPDAAFVSKERAQSVGGTERYWPGAPDFAAEVVSPGDTRDELEDKAFGWLEAGTKAVLVIDPERRCATVYRGRDDVRGYGENEIIDLSDAVPGWRLAVAKLFR